MEIYAGTDAATPVPIAQAAADVIRAAAVAALPHEACGLLFADGGGQIVSASVAQNVAACPHRRFEIDPAHLFAAQRGVRGSGLWLAGCWHSHPDGSPSPSSFDRAGVGDLSWLWLIVAAGVIRLFRPAAAGFAPLILSEVDIAAVAPPLAGR